MARLSTMPTGLLLAAWTLCVASPAGESSGRADAARSLATATGFLQRGMNDLAVAEYRRFLEAAPDDPQATNARYGLAVALHRLNDCDGAAREAARVVREPGFGFVAEALWILASCTKDATNGDSALTATRVLLERFPDHDLADDAAALQIELLFSRGERKSFHRAAESFVERFPDAPQRERVEYLRAIPADGTPSADAASRLAEFVERYPQSPYRGHAWLLLGRLRADGGDATAARAAYEHAIATLEGGDDAQRLAEALAALAALLASQGDWNAAAAPVDRILRDFEQHPVAATARLVRARMHLEQGDLEPAQRLLAQLAERDEPQAEDAAYWLARCTRRLGRDCDAATRLATDRKRFARGRLRVELAIEHAAALRACGNAGVAAEVLAEVADELPGHALEPDALLLIAVCEHDRKRYESSLKACAAAIARFGDHRVAVEAEYLNAENLLALERLDDAAAAFQAFRARHSEHDRADDAAARLGAVLTRLGRTDEAAAALASTPLDRVDAALAADAAAAQAEVHLARGEWERAESLLLARLDAGGEADRTATLLRLAYAQRRRGDDRAAEQSLTSAIESSAASDALPTALFERAQARLALNDADAARADLERVVTAFPEAQQTGAALLQLSGIALSAGRAAAAIELGEAALNKVRESGERHAALLYVAGARRALSDFEGAEQAFDAALELAPDDAAARAGRGACRVRLERFAAALEDIDASLARTDTGFSADARDALRYDRATCLRALNRTEDHHAALRDLCAEDVALPLRAYAAAELAELEAAAGRHAEVIRLLSPITTGAPDGGDVPETLLEGVRYRLAAAQLATEDWTAAGASFAAFAELHPNSAHALSACFFAGDAMFRAGSRGAAVAWLERAAGGPADAPYTGAAALRLGECLAGEQRWAESERVYAAYLDRHRTGERRREASFGLGWAREQSGRHAEAMTAYQEAAAGPRDALGARAQFQIGQCLFALSRFEEAVAELVKVDILFSSPEWAAAALYEAGRCFERQARTAEARRQFEEVVRRFGATEWAKLAAAALEGQRTAPPPGG